MLSIPFLSDPYILKVLLMKTIFIFLLCFYINVDARQEHILVKSSDANWVTEVSIYYPKGVTDAKEIVIHLPGTDGIGEPSFRRFQQLTKNSISSKSSLTKEITGHGYVFISFNTRGIYPLRSCLANSSFVDVAGDFLRSCWNKDVRGKLDWINIESDIVEIIDAIKQHKNFKNRKIILLARSEGGMHAARLVRSKKIQVDGFVGLGVPTVAPFENARSQVAASLYLSRLIDYMGQKRINVFYPRMVDVVFPNMLENHRASLLDMIGNDGITTDRAEKLLQSNAIEFDNQVPELLSLDRSLVLSGDMNGESIDVMASMGWWQDSLLDKVDFRTSMMNYHGKSVFLYGEYDYQVGRDLKTACGGDSTKQCVMRTISGVDHSLYDQSGNYSRRALKSIIRAIREVTPKTSQKVR